MPFQDWIGGQEHFTECEVGVFTQCVSERCIRGEGFAPCRQLSPELSGRDIDAAGTRPTPVTKQWAGKSKTLRLKTPSKETGANSSDLEMRKKVNSVAHRLAELARRSVS